MNEDMNSVPGRNGTDQPPQIRDPFDAVKAVAQPKDAQAHAPSPQPTSTTGVLTPGDASADNAAGPDAATAGTVDYGDFAWPDGYMADPTAMAKFVPLAQKLGLEKEDAQSLATLYAEIDQERNREQARFISENNARWLKEIQSHPEFGGQNLDHTGENVAAMMRRYGTPLLTAQIRQMNVQNWPEMFFFLARVSQAVSEDCSPSSFSAAAPAKSTAQLLFPGLK